MERSMSSTVPSRLCRQLGWGRWNLASGGWRQSIGANDSATGGCFVRSLHCGRAERNPASWAIPVVTGGDFGLSIKATVSTRCAQGLEDGKHNPNETFVGTHFRLSHDTSEKWRLLHRQQK